MQVAFDAADSDNQAFLMAVRRRLLPVPLAPAAAAPVAAADGAAPADADMSAPPAVAVAAGAL